MGHQGRISRKPPVDITGWPEHIQDNNRAGIYLIERGILRRVAETSLKGVGDTLICLRDEGEIAPDDCVGVLDQVERHWLLNPWVRPR